MIHFEDGGGDPWDKGIDEDWQKSREKSADTVLQAGLYFEARVKEKLIGPRSGRMYGSHQASAPGEPPSTDQGDLRKSITTSLPIWSGNEVSVEVGSNLAKAALLEYGGYTGRNHATRILPRPYMSATFLEEVDAIGGILEGVFS